MRFVDRSPGALVETAKPVVSAALLAKPEGKTDIPWPAAIETQWDHLKENRRRLDACVMQSSAQADVIRAMTGEGAE